MDDQPPRDVSNQNAEEPSAPHGPSDEPPDEDRRREPADDPGPAKEGGQATGHPQNAG
jgi:hypothetical protein